MPRGRKFASICARTIIDIQKKSRRCWASHWRRTAACLDRGRRGPGPDNCLTAAACAALGISRATVYRRRARLSAPSAVARPRPKPVRALTGAQRQTVLDLLHGSRFADQAPAEIYATLLDEVVYHCSIRTMYRLLDANGELRERRQQLRHPAYQKPELLAEKPNEVWSWDITKLMGPSKWHYFYLYVILDIFSRRVVGWQVADAETALGFGNRRGEP